jgi:hypothetical protein
MDGNTITSTVESPKATNFRQLMVIGERFVTYLFAFFLALFFCKLWEMILLL